MSDALVDLDSLRRLTTFSAAMRRSIVDVVGGGKDGTVYKTYRRTAVKLHRSDAIYRRELDAYQLMRERRVETVGGFRVPQLVSFHDKILAIEMTLVEPPFIVDFASAILDEEWREDPQLEEQLRELVSELFDERAVDVMFALDQLANVHGIHLFDARPANIAFE